MITKFFNNYNVKFSLGVRLPHYVIYNRLNWQWNHFPYSDTEQMCVFKTSLTFVDSVAEIWAPLLHDIPRCLMVIPKAITKDPELLINTLHNNKVTNLVNLIFKKILFDSFNIVQENNI